VKSERPRRLIINADDLGYDPAINRGIVEAMRKGAVTSATLMVNLPHSAEGAALASGLAVGLHLNLARGMPVSPRFPPTFLVSGALEGLTRAAGRRGIPVRALDAAMRTTLRARGVRTTDHFVGEAGAEPYWTAARFSEALAALEPGTTEWMCHPGHLPSHVKSGYAAQRVVELETLGRPEARGGLERAGVELVSFAAV